MALPEQSIGEHKFIILQGNPVVPSEKLVIDEWLGIDGTEITRTGKRGIPFTMVSQVDQTTLKAADTTYQEYLDMIEDDPQTLTQDGEAVAGAKFQVLDVERIRRTSITESVGGLKNNPQALLVCAWTMIGIAN